MSLISISLAGPAQAAITANPATIDLMFDEMETKTPQQIPGAKMISKRRMTEGAIRGLEMKVDIKGNINLMRFYVVPDAMICAEFISRNEAGLRIRTPTVFHLRQASPMAESDRRSGTDARRSRGEWFDTVKRSWDHGSIAFRSS